MTTISQTKLAQLLGVSVGRVSQLKTEGRLVVRSDGIDLAATLQRLRDTADPGKASALRLDRAAAWLESSLRQSADDEAPETTAGDDQQQQGNPAYREARTRKERAMADMAELEYLLASGEVMTLESANFILADIGGRLHTAVEISPDRLAPTFVGANQADIEAALRTMLRDSIAEARALHRRHMEQARSGATPGHQ